MSEPANQFELSDETWNLLKKTKVYQDIFDDAKLNQHLEEAYDLPRCYKLKEESLKMREDFSKYLEEHEKNCEDKNTDLKVIEDGIEEMKGHCFMSIMSNISCSVSSEFQRILLDRLDSAVGSVNCSDLERSLLQRQLGFSRNITNQATGSEDKRRSKLLSFLLVHRRLCE